MISRRQFLTLLAAAPLLATNLPDLSPAEAALPAAPFDWFGERVWRIAFPDGSVFMFMGHVTSMTESLTKATEVTVQPTGPLHALGDPDLVRSRLRAASSAPLSSDGVEIANVQEISLPSLIRHEIQMDDGTFIPGPMRVSPFTFTLNGEWK